MHKPRFGSQTLLALLLQSSFVAHEPHCPAFLPAVKQNGASFETHGCAAFEPMSPSHAVHVKVSRSHMGVAPAQVSESRQLTHAPRKPGEWQTYDIIFEAPVIEHRPERHTVWAVSVVHGPTPLPSPHSSSLVSHTPLEHTRVAASSVQVPSRDGFACGVSVGMAMPLSRVGKQALLVSLHQLPVAQSASTLQPSAGKHTPPSELHLAERHTVVPSSAVHGP